MKAYRYVWLLPLITLAVEGMAHAQETRADALRQAREEKQATVSPYEPTLVEKALKIVEAGSFPLITRDGIYAKFGSLTTGSARTSSAADACKMSKTGCRSSRMWF